MANRFNYKITLKNHPPVIGSVIRPHGAMHIVVDLPEDEIVKAEGSLNVPMSADGWVFMNGYQSWTYSTEHSRVGRTHGVSRLPKAISVTTVWTATATTTGSAIRRRRASPTARATATSGRARISG